MRQITHLFCGNPGGGTSFTANYLTQLGFPCGHEMLCHVESEGEWHVGPSGEAEFGGGRLIDRALGESSYIAIDWCDREPFAQTPLVMVCRNPVSVLNSNIAIRVRDGEQVKIDSIMSEIVGRYHRIISHPRLSFRFKVENELPELCEHLGLRFERPTDVPTRRHSNGRICLNYSDYSAYSNHRKLCECARELGYSVA